MHGLLESQEARAGKMQTAHTVRACVNMLKPLLATRMGELWRPYSLSIAVLGLLSALIVYASFFIFFAF
jgi:hypothetical protein